MVIRYYSAALHIPIVHILQNSLEVLFITYAHPVVPFMTAPVEPLMQTWR